MINRTSLINLNRESTISREAGAAKHNHFSRLKKGGQRPPSTMTRQGYDDKRSWSKFAKQKTL